ncbi:YopX family protein [Lysinibacillus halotolerans]
MREIKFNFYDTIKKKYIRWEESNAGMSMSAFITHKHLKFLQFTGRLDKNGREIFLGDIAKREFDIWRQDFDSDGGCLGDELVDEGFFIGVVSQTPRGLYVLNKCRKYDVEGNLIAKRSNVELYAHHCEIIGNIYEHPHLLEGDAG